jgi:hypothetical protein
MFVFYVRSKIFHALVGLQNLGLCSALRALGAGRDLYCATSVMTRGHGCFGLIRRTTPIESAITTDKGYGDLF